MNTLDRLFQLTPGGLLGNRYRLDRCLGDGTYGFVWKAENLIDQTVVAVKIPKLQSGKNSDLEEGRQLIDTLPHPNVVRVRWMGRVPPEKEIYAIEMEFFNSHTLAFLLDAQEDRLVSSYQYLLSLYEQILSGVCHLHALGICHGDIKPQNILVGGDIAKLTDFGSSLTTQDVYLRSRENGGTVLYSPPEAAGLATRPKNEQLLISHDIYSLGVLLYQLLTGRFPHDTLAQVVRHSPFPRPTELSSCIAPELDAVVMRALEAEPQNRWASAEELRSAFLSARSVQLSFRPNRASVRPLERHQDWSSHVTKLLDQQAWREAEAAAYSEYQRSNDPHAFLLMVRAAVRDERYFDAIHVLERQPLLLESEKVGGDIEQLALEAFIHTERVNEAAQMVERCIKRQGERPGLLLRKASLLGLQARYMEARDILVQLNRKFPHRPVLLRKLVLVHEQLRDLEQARAYQRVLEKIR